MESTPPVFLGGQCNGTLFLYGFGMGSIIIIIAVDGVNGYEQPCCERTGLVIYLGVYSQVD